MSGSGPSLNIRPPSLAQIFELPPHNAPEPIPPPFESPSFRTPFDIPADIYTAALRPVVPLTIATVYATTVFLTNAYNRRHGNKPWAISKTRLFHAFVIFHNVFLAIYSAATFVAMVGALKRTLPHYSEPNALVGTVDALCKMHGPRGLGDAVTYNSTTSSWESKNSAIRLGANGQPDTSDVGRLWNEGLAFWGWWFYLSKFYEVLDTFIILAKGKRSSTLQTYHHTGAMLCMWSGIRYMSAPIWIFCLFNSGIHAMMYTYYTLSALRYRIPQRIKRSLTTLQIMQFIIGASSAGIFLFFAYTVPVSVPFFSSEPAASVTSSVSSAATSSTIASVASAATGAAAALLKKMVYRAAGEEGLAENVAAPLAAVQEIAAQVQAPQQALKQAAKKVFYRTQYQEVDCIHTTAQSLAVVLNLIYLAPLTFLFARFFVKSYIKRGASAAKHPTMQRRLSKAGQDAVRGVNREIESLGKAAEDGFNEAVMDGPKKVRKAVSSANGSGLLPEKKQEVVESFNRKVSESLEKHNLNGRATAQAAKEIAEDIISRASSPRGKKAKASGSAPRENGIHPGENGDTEEVVAEAGIAPLENGETTEGLSTTDPKEAGINYADMVKAPKP